MKQNLLNKLWLRVWMIVAVMTTALAGTAAADKVTLVSGSGTSGYAIPEGWTSSGTIAGGSYLKFDNGSITSPEFAPHTELSFTYTVATFGSGTNHPLQITILDASTEEVIYQTETETPTSSSYISTGSPLSLGDVSVPFKIQLYGSTGKGVRLRNYSITGTPVGGGSSAVATITTIDASGITNTDVYAGTEAGSLAATVKAGEETINNAIVTWSGNNDAVATIDEEGKVTLVAAGTVTFTATYAGVEDEYESSSDTYEMTVTDTTPVPTHTATFSVNGVTSTQDFEEGAAINFPDVPADVEGKTFVGWVTEAIDGTTNDAPSFVTSATMGEADVTYYAVFANANGGGSSEVVDVLNRDLTGVTGTSYAAWSGKTATSSAVYAGQSAGGNNAIQLRSNNNNSGIVTTTSGGKVKEVAITWESHTDAARIVDVYGKNTAYTAAADLYASATQGTKLGTIQCSTNEVLTVDGDYEYIGIRSNSGALYMEEVKITWSTGGGVTYSGYCTTVVAAAVARPTIEVEANPFLFSTTATITCETEGAVIKYSFDGETWNDYTEELTITATTTLYAKAVKDVNESEVASVTITKNLAVPAVAIDATGITNTNVYEGTAAGSLAASVSYNDAAVEGATVTWGGNNDEVATIDAATGAVTLVGAGTVTFTATYAGNEDYAEKTATYEMTVTNSDPNAPGTENNPYTVAAAKKATPTVSDVYIRGIVSAFYNTSIVGDGSNYRYYISDDGTTEGQLLVYKGKGLDNVAFDSADDLKMGDVVVIYGKLTTYQDAPEVASGNYIVSLDRPVVTTPSIAINPASVNATTAETEGTVAITFENLTISAANDFDVQFFDGEGNELQDAPEWIDAEVEADGEGYAVSYIIVANDGEARTAYFKVYAMDDETNLVYSNLVTVSQAGYVVDYATLPFEWNTKTAPTGVTTSGTGTYSSTPYLKFDSTGDYIVLKLNEDPGMLWFDIKGNSISGAYTFKVQTSTDGTTYEDLKTFGQTTIESTTQTVALSLNADVRYIKWIYEVKATGNVALGNIIVDKAEIVTVGEAGYATYVTKHNVSFPNDVEAYITSEVNTEKGYVSMEQVTAVPKGTPVVLKNEGTFALTPATADGLADVSENELKASETDIEADGTQYVLAKPGEEVGFYKADKGTTIAAGKAYLQITGEAPVKGFTFIFGDEADGISEIENGKLKVEGEGAIYNLAGQRIQKMQRGVNIVNGKKILK